MKIKSMQLYSNFIHKMLVEMNQPIQYILIKKDQETLLLNNFIEKNLKLEWSGQIQCSSCAKIIQKSFGEGFCYTCFISAPEASECIIRPELCRAHLGQGRNVEWEERNHNQPHVVYLAASDKVKVGITRKTNVPMRWIDQGASFAIILAETPNRYLAGVLEVELKNHFSDKTNWQRMLKNEQDESIDLVHEKWSLEDILPIDLIQYFTDDEEVVEIKYPVLNYPNKVKSLSFDKTPIIEGKLIGIKGQYLIFENGDVLNIRKHTGYEIQISVY
jgi:hypothetical protein